MFEKSNLKIETQDDARKKKIDSDSAWSLIEIADSIVIGKGKKRLTYKPEDSSKDDILKAALGRTGNLRAPAIQINKRLIIGFNEEMYKEFVI